jgi:hypothetical protein
MHLIILSHSIRVATTTVLVMSNERHSVDCGNGVGVNGACPVADLCITVASHNLATTRKLACYQCDKPAS